MDNEITTTAGARTQYRGWTIERIVATQVGHSLPNSNSTMQRHGFGTRRKVNGYEATAPDGHSIFHPTLANTKINIDLYEGDIVAG